MYGVSLLYVFFGGLSSFWAGEAKCADCFFRLALVIRLPSAGEGLYFPRQRGQRVLAGRALLFSAPKSKQKGALRGSQGLVLWLLV